MNRRRVLISVENQLAAKRRNRRRGFVLLTMSTSAIALFGALGMSVDLGRVFITKHETQAFCDAGALAAVLQLDGTTNGITNAKNAVTNSTNKWNLASTAISNPTVTFATSASGPWVDSPNPATGYIYAQVAATATMPLYFIGVVVGRTTQDVISSAKAGQVAYSPGGSLFRQGLTPYSVVSTNTTGPNFGMTVGTAYDIHWPNFSGTKGACGPGNLDKCFSSNPCAGDAGNTAAEAAVLNYWQSSSTKGYWGSSSNASIEQEIVDTKQVASVGVGTNLGSGGLNILTSGNKNSEGGYLDERVNQDINTTDNDLTAYTASSHNGRRLLPVPVLDPTDASTTKVIGYAVMFLYANGPGTSNFYTKGESGNDPYCAMYAGSYSVGSTNPGAAGSGGSTGAVRVRLVF